MKRFAMTISLAACLVFLGGSVAMAANHIEVDSIHVPPGATNVTVGVYITNDIPIQGLVMPLEIRNISGGGYIVAPMTRGATPGNRLQHSPLDAAYDNMVDSVWPGAQLVQNRYPNPDGPACASPGWNGYASPGANIDFVSPDAILHAAVSAGNPGAGELIFLGPGSDPPGSPSYRFIMNMTVAQGAFVIDTTCTTPANHLSYVDAQNQVVTPTFDRGKVVIEVPPNACPTPTADNAVVNATVGSVATNDVDATDPENNQPFTFSKVSGPGTVDPNTGEWSYVPLCSDIPSFQVTVGVTDTQHPGGPCNQVSFTVNVSPAPLSIQCSNVSGHWGDILSQSPTIGGGCPPYTLSLQSGPGEIDGSIWDYPTGCGSIGSAQVTLRATDATQAFVECTFTATVTNLDPECSDIPATLAEQAVETIVDLGDLSQADGDGLTYALVSGTGWPDEDITGDKWSASRPLGDAASYVVVYTVSDGCVTIECSFDVIFEKPCIAIVKEGTDSSYGQWLNGEHATVCVVAEPGAIPDDGNAGGYDFLICYDASGLSFLGADGGPEGWEYFTYRTGPFGGNCTGGCPDGYIRLISIAEMNNGVELDPADFDLDGKVLACMTFNITSDRNFINSCLHVGFCSFDCGDNVISSVSGNVVWTPSDGVNLGPYYNCDGNNKPGDTIYPVISYCPGAICIVEPPDDRGDLNLNGIAYEIGDAVLYTNYFIYGSGVWNPTWMQVQILASDINDDGIVLTVADLIYLIRVITGDEQPFPPGTGNGSPKVSPYANAVDVLSDVSNGAVTVRTNSSVDIGAALLVFRYEGSVGAPLLANNSGLQVRSNAANGELRVLISQTVESAASRLTAGSNSLVTIPVNGNIELVESQFSDYNGGLLSVNAASASLPTEYALLQNYPNPFNAGTIIPFAMVEGGKYELTIYNVAGQVVRTFAGEGVAGINRIEWNGRTEGGDEAATGMYFYRVTTPKFSSTKKMVLIK